MAHSGKIKELYRLAVSGRCIGYLAIYMPCLAYIPDHRKYPMYRVLRHIYPRCIGYLRVMFLRLAVPVQSIFGINCTGIVDFSH